MSMPIVLLALSLAADCPPFAKAATGGDYYDAQDAKGLAVVENFHFGPQVEALKSGQSGPLGGDIAYTLEHFPNHPRALSALARLSLRQKRETVLGARLSTACHFERAIAYRPQDGAARALYGAYLMALRRDADALQQLEAAVAAQPANAMAWYNLGLLHLRRKDHAAALAAAHTAYRLGLPLPGLRKQLKAAGKWQEAPSLDPVVAH